MSVLLERIRPRRIRSNKPMERVSLCENAHRALSPGLIFYGLYSCAPNPVLFVNCILKVLSVKVYIKVMFSCRILRIKFALLAFIALQAAVGMSTTGLVSALSGNSTGVFPNNRQMPLFKKMYSGIPDTLEIFVLYVQFKSEDPDDNPSTTGKGTFNSAKDTTFKLDPNGFHDYVYYLEKHLEFASNYFRTISNGRLILKWRMFPAPAADNGRIQAPIMLEKRMAAYNPNIKKKDEKRIVFYERKARALMSFIAEALRRADRLDSADNPFSVPGVSNNHKYRSYLIFHAGHSGLIDGGKLGQIGADTPNDIIDFFVTREDFALLNDVSEASGSITNPYLAQAADSAGVAVSSGDTITQVMVLSESASQDEVNFGISGILVNQIARQIGMPDTWDRGTGFTQLGYFDLMDVGHLALYGFMPVFPSAWVRYYMGWETPVTARPGVNGESEYIIKSAISSLTGGVPGVQSVKIPINEREYLLVENRQKSLNDSITIYFSKPLNKNDPKFSVQDSVTINTVQIDSLLLDSLCDDKGKNCVVNPYRPQGVITGASSYDMGVPGSGLVVWHVNEWFIEQWVPYGIVNISNDDTKEFTGLSLVEADGDLSIGKEGKDNLGQSVFDFGSASDVLPHIRKYLKEPREDSVWARDTVRYIWPYGHANTNSWNDGKSHIVLEAPLPVSASGPSERSINPVWGDSIYSYANTALTLKVYWNKNPNIQLKAGWQWPAMTAVSTHPQALALIKFANSGLASLISNEGYIQLLGPDGRGAVAAIDTLSIPNTYDSLNTLIPTLKTTDTLQMPVSSLGGPLGVPLGHAVIEDTIICMLSQDGYLHFNTLLYDSLASINNSASYNRVSINSGGILGPIVVEGNAWVITSTDTLCAYNPLGQSIMRIGLPHMEYHSLSAARNLSTSQWELIIAGQGGRVVWVDISQLVASEITSGQEWASANQYFSVSVSDFDRDGSNDALVLGSRNAATIMSRGGVHLPNYPIAVERSAAFVDTGNNVTLITGDGSAPALGDLNNDGYPEFVFTGTNGIWVVDFKGAVIPGWPFLFETHQNVGMLYSSSQYPSSVIQTTPVICDLNGQTTVLCASPDGLIWALDAQGNPLKITGYDETSSQALYSGIKSTSITDWPLAVGGLNFDTTDSPYIHLTLGNLDGGADLELMAQTGTGHLFAWALPAAKLTAGSAWQGPGGNFMRQNFLDVSVLNVPSALQPQAVIHDFHLFPSPLKGAIARIHLDIGAPAGKARLRVFDIAGGIVRDITYPGFPLPGLQPYISVDLSSLGPDVYSALMEVWFENGSKKQKFINFGVIR